MTEDYTTHPNLAKIKIVLIETSHPGNIGAVARAMKNMGLSQLVLVNPKEYPSQVASARASSASDILNAAQVFATLEEAVAGCQVVVGASARLRKVSWPQMDVRETAAKAMQITDAPDGQVAILFGREDSGLSNLEMDKCHYLAHIPSNPDYCSLNIAAAVQVFAYEFLMAANLKADVALEGYKHEQATADQMEGFYTHLQEGLIDIAFLETTKNARFMRRMRRLFNRTELDVREIDILRGVLTAAQRQAKQLKSLLGSKDV